MKEKTSKLAILTKGIIRENPVLVLLLGTCPTLATTSSAFNGMGMGIAATAVLIYGSCHNVCTYLFKHCNFHIGEGYSRQGKNPVLHSGYRRFRYPGTVHRSGIC